MSYISSHVENASQGILYWMGYRKSLYNGCTIREIPIADQFCTILKSSFNDGSTVQGEVSYEELLWQGASEFENLKTKFADVVIYDVNGNVDTVIEIKRYTSIWKEIHDDLKRLAVLKRDRPNIKVYELIIGDQVTPREFIDPSTARAISGNIFITESKVDKNPLNGDYVECSVVRACSLTSKKLSINGLENDPIAVAADLYKNAYYACILEIKK